MCHSSCTVLAHSIDTLQHNMYIMYMLLFKLNRCIAYAGRKLVLGYL